MKFSKLKQGFYPDALLLDYAAAGTLPDDLQDISAEDHAALFDAQSAGKIIDWSGAVPVAVDPPPEAAASVLARLVEAIKAERDRRKEGGVLVGGKWFQTDTDSCVQFLGLKDKGRDLLAAGGAMTDPIKVLGQNVVWRTLDGSYALITVQAAFDIVSAKGDLDAMAFKVCETHRATIAKAPDPAAYDFSAGWPAIFGS